MASLTIQERFELDAPPDHVWEHLIDPERIVVCLPGAELLGQEDERTYSGAVKVKVGAVTVVYRGTIVFEERDDSAGYLRLVGKGREKSGSGSAEIELEFGLETDEQEPAVLGVQQGRSALPAQQVEVREVALGLLLGEHVAKRQFSILKKLAEQKTRLLPKPSVVRMSHPWASLLMMVGLIITIYSREAFFAISFSRNHL